MTPTGSKSSAGRPRAEDAELLRAFADRVARRCAPAAAGDHGMIGGDTVRELLAVVETLTRREIARAEASALRADRPREADDDAPGDPRPTRIGVERTATGAATAVAGAERERDRAA
jgi:hypothetical protein